ncbi:hypothetical protein Tco_0992296 [Tanacetum coccineum]|uniref:Uncharacterized protein n=1 Tax=Tanacetum coccineum TaxID=301880 RepID=A0ABQ5F202_9ASTR
METNDKEPSAAGMDNCPPMSEESDFKSWKIREGEQQTQVTREKTDEEFTEAENNKERADIQATDILSQGLPRHIFNTLNQTKTAKEIWENVELLMQGSGLTEQQKKETLFDQYERLQQRVFNKELRDIWQGNARRRNEQRTHSGSKTRHCLWKLKRKGTILDAEAKAFLIDVECTTPYAEPLAITTTTEFEVRHEDPYDSDVDEAPHAAAAFMANLMHTGPSTRQGTSNDTDFHLEIHGGEQLDSDVDLVIDDHDNTIPYHQYQLNNEVESVLTDVSSIVPGGIFVITILDDLRKLKAQIGNMKEVSTDSILSTLEFQALETENTQLKEELTAVRI